MKQRDTNYLKWGLILGGLWWMWGKSVHTLIKLHFYLQRVYIVNIDIDRGLVRLKLDLSVKNTTVHKLVVKHIKCDVSFNEQLIANVDQNIYQYIHPKSISTVSIAIDVQASELAKRLLQQLNTGMIDNWRINLNGIATADNLYFPFDIDLLAEDVLPPLQ